MLLSLTLHCHKLNQVGKELVSDMNQALEKHGVDMSVFALVSTFFFGMLLCVCLELNYRDIATAIVAFTLKGTFSVEC